MLLKLGKVLHGMQKDQKEKKGEEGFTLIELLVVVIIIGILAAIAIPVFLGQRDNARDAAAQSSARNALSATQAYYTESESYTGIEANNFQAMSDIEPSLDYAAAPVADNPNAVGITVEDVAGGTDNQVTDNQVTIGVASASGDSFWIRRNDTGTLYGVTEDALTVPAAGDFAAGGF